MTRLFCALVPLGIVLMVASQASACGGGGGGIASAGGGGKGFAMNRSPMMSFAGAPMMSAPMVAMSPMPSVRMAAAAQAAAYNARMRPIRLARATQMRADKLAKREERRQVYLAQRAAKERAEQEFLASARQWTDSSGSYQVSAIMVNANADWVRLKKSDGKTVDVRRAQLSLDDQIWVASNMTSPTRNSGVMLAQR